MSLFSCAGAVRRRCATAACRPRFLVFASLPCVLPALKSYLTPDLLPCYSAKLRLSRA